MTSLIWECIVPVGGICGGVILGVYFDHKGLANEISRFYEGEIHVSVPGGSGEC